jgi:transcriptional regulator with XRE-family HTH domain
MNIVNRVIGRKIRKLRKEKGLKTRDSSVGYKDLRQEWCRKIASKLSKTRLLNLKNGIMTLCAEMDLILRMLINHIECVLDQL